MIISEFHFFFLILKIVDIYVVLLQQKLLKLLIVNEFSGVELHSAFFSIVLFMYEYVHLRPHHDVYQLSNPVENVILRHITQCSNLQ